MVQNNVARFYFSRRIGGRSDTSFGYSQRLRR